MHTIGVAVASLLGSLINLNGTGRYIHWGFIRCRSRTSF